MKPDFSKGLVPAVIVDNHTEQVLMLAYMNEEAYQKTLETKQTWFYSRSRNELWNKGATSGNFQTVKSIQLDCDQDTLLIRVDPKGPACHTGETSCFFETVMEEDVTRYDPNIFEEVMAEIEDRLKVKVEGSYTNYLFEKGIDKIGKKVIEEAGEVIIAAKNRNKEEVMSEVSDLLYHCFVLMAEQNVSLEDIKAKLTKRFSKKGNHKGERPEIKEW
ncbi:bifunctional phosphoribosyl-AMP cyclohydrolase/phosphoribosyl-ATP diphosphatase HisIE [Aquibacillus albus]|uniref:Histidine biosynthesis bifunctional protein HisIE n=1 Tax=Aquibacillus albus TaxID=1168171 RepID=A0ABS2N2B4_9BACI|nr:phosphoribosyl-ATP pyrophosphohydrolase/phosphoribosyl-AMP cyclohydrolase [Aquibacillus albus]